MRMQIEKVLRDASTQRGWCEVNIFNIFISRMTSISLKNSIHRHKVNVLTK